MSNKNNDNKEYHILWKIIDELNIRQSHTKGIQGSNKISQLNNEVVRDNETYRLLNDDDLIYMKKRILAFNSFIDDRVWKVINACCGHLLGLNNNKRNDLIQKTYDKNKNLKDWKVNPLYNLLKQRTSMLK